MMNWSFSINAGYAPRFLSFEASQRDHLLPSNAFTSRPIVDDQNQRTHYSSVQEGRVFPFCSHPDQTTYTSEPGLQSLYRPERKRSNNNLINFQPLGRPIGSPPGQLTIFYAGSVSVYEDISPEKADAIMLLAINGPQAKPVPMSKPQKPVHHSLSTIYPPSMPHSFLPSTSYIVSENGSESNVGTGLGTTKTVSSLASTPRNNQTKASVVAPSVGLSQARKASLNRFLVKRKERVINVSPYYVDNK